MTTQLTRQGAPARSTQSTAPAGHGMLRGTVRRIRQAVQEMNYASRRTVELQAPWTVDRNWHRR